MNFKRGLLRLWIVASGVWMTLVLLISNKLPSEILLLVFVVPPFILGALLSALIWIASGFRRND
jgi:hypothetical protein